MDKLSLCRGFQTLFYVNRRAQRRSEYGKRALVGKRIGWKMRWLENSLVGIETHNFASQSQVFSFYFTKTRKQWMGENFLGNVFHVDTLGWRKVKTLVPVTTNSSKFKCRSCETGIKLSLETI